MGRRTPHEVVPLTRWIHGRVRVHFRSGHVAEVRTSLHSAHSIRRQADNAEGGESIDGLESHDGWLAGRSEEIVLTEWTPDPDYGWRDMSPEDRERLRALGMKHGILCALAELWSERGGQPSYSTAAVSSLFGLAMREDVTRAHWDRVAEKVEGVSGARLVASAWKELGGHNVPARLVDDGAKPESASSESESSDAERGGAPEADADGQDPRDAGES